MARRVQKMQKPYSFRVSTEALRAFRKASPEDKLNWLEEANEFIAQFVPQEKREAWVRFIQSRLRSGSNSKV